MLKNANKYKNFPEKFMERFPERFPERVPELHAIPTPSDPNCLARFAERGPGPQAQMTKTIEYIQLLTIVNIFLLWSKLHNY